MPGAVSTKVIHLILSSGNIYPYRWEYTYWNGSSPKGWIGFQPTLDSTNAGANITILTDPATNVPTISAADEVFVVTYGSTTLTAILDAIAANSLPVMLYNGNTYITTQYTSSAVTLTDITSGNGSRFRGFPVNIDVLSRFRTAQQQKATMQKLRAGSIDLRESSMKTLSQRWQALS